MARLFQALVVLGGGVVGCGRNVDLENSGTAGDDPGAQSGAGSAAMNPMGTGGAGAGGVPRGGSANTSGATNTGGMSAVTAQGGVSAAGASVARAGSGFITVDPVLPSGGGAARGPEACPPARWECETVNCARDNAEYCGSTWTGAIETCPELSPTDCTCSSDLDESARDCGAGEVFTCRAGWFEVTGDSDAGGAELLQYECRCVPRQEGPGCEDACESHGVGGYQRACVDQGDLVLCGGCVYTGILR